MIFQVFFSPDRILRKDFPSPRQKERNDAWTWRREIRSKFFSSREAKPLRLRDDGFSQISVRAEHTFGDEVRGVVVSQSIGQRRQMHNSNYQSHGTCLVAIDMHQSNRKHYSTYLHKHMKTINSRCAEVSFQEEQNYWRWGLAQLKTVQAAARLQASILIIHSPDYGCGRNNPRPDGWNLITAEMGQWYPQWKVSSRMNPEWY